MCKNTKTIIRLRLSDFQQPKELYIRGQQPKDLYIGVNSQMTYS